MSEGSDHFSSKRIKELIERCCLKNFSATNSSSSIEKGER